jgi:putative phage-type endonuclease
MCRSSEDGGRRCIGHYNARVNTVTKKLDVATAKVKEAAEKRAVYMEHIENIKQEKRDIRARIKDEKRKITPEETARIESLNIQLELTDEMRKLDDPALKDLKWEAAELAEKEHQRKLDRDEKTGQHPVLNYEAERLGTASFTGQFEEDSDEWHEQRAQGIGGSDVAAIMGVSPFLKESKLFELKTGQTVTLGAESISSAMALGNIYEPIIQRRFAEEHPELQLWNTKGSWKADKHSHQLANIDGLYAPKGSTEPTGILEIKAVSSEHGWETEPPIYYRQQALWYMDTFGFKEAKFAVLINQYDYREYTITPREGEMEEIHAKVDAFKKRVEDYRLAA